MFLGLRDPDSLVRGMDPNPDQDSLVRGMDLRIRIRIHTKMSWIRNTAFFISYISYQKEEIGDPDLQIRFHYNYCFLFPYSEC
jgi:hypothetical protein